MPIQSLQERITERARHLGEWFRALGKNTYFWLGLGGLFLLMGGLYLLVDDIVMPNYTRHDVSVTVPRVVDRPLEEANQILRRSNLQVEHQRARQYNPNVPRGEVLDQQPPANALVKPGRRIYLTINEGRTPMVEVPDLEGTSVREAKNQLMALGLKAGRVRADTIPAPYSNTITKQSPAPGDSLREGSSVHLWYSRGLGNAYATVPDVRNMRVPAARRVLLNHKLRSVVLDAEEGMQLNQEFVRAQGREPGSEVREGTEIRLFINRDSASTDGVSLGEEQQ